MIFIWNHPFYFIRKREVFSQERMGKGANKSKISIYLNMNDWSCFVWRTFLIGVHFLFRCCYMLTAHNIYTVRSQPFVDNSLLCTLFKSIFILRCGCCWCCCCCCSFCFSFFFFCPNWHWSMHTQFNLDFYLRLWYTNLMFAILLFRSYLSFFFSVPCTCLTTHHSRTQNDIESKTKIES